MSQEIIVADSEYQKNAKQFFWLTLLDLVSVSMITIYSDCLINIAKNTKSTKIKKKNYRKI